MRRTKEQWKAIDARKSERYSKIGREFEIWVYELLKQSNLFGKVVLHETNSDEDSNGKDITVEGFGVELSFGVTISHRCSQRGEIKHPGIKDYWFPIGTKPETIVNKIYKELQKIKNNENQLSPSNVTTSMD